MTERLYEPGKILNGFPVILPVGIWVSSIAILVFPVQIPILEQLNTVVSRAMNTGHEGSLTTLHANSPGESISRLTTMVRYVAELPVDVIEANIASAICLVVQTRRALDGSRFISDIVTFSFNSEAGRCQVHPLYSRQSDKAAGRWIEAPDWLEDLEMMGISTLKEVDEWKHACSLVA